MRSFGGGTAGYTKLITVFGSIGGIAVFLALCTATIGEYLGSVIFGIIGFFLYFLLGDSNLHRHQVTGAKNFQEIHVWFTLSFAVVIWAFY